MSGPRRGGDGARRPLGTTAGIDIDEEERRWNEWSAQVRLAYVRWQEAIGRAIHEGNALDGALSSYLGGIRHVEPVPYKGRISVLPPPVPIEAPAEEDTVFMEDPVWAEEKETPAWDREPSEPVVIDLYQTDLCEEVAEDAIEVSLPVPPIRKMAMLAKSGMDWSEPSDLEEEVAEDATTFREAWQAWRQEQEKTQGNVDPRTGEQTTCAHPGCFAKVGRHRILDGFSPEDSRKARARRPDREETQWCVLHGPAGALTGMKRVGEARMPAPTRTDVDDMGAQARMEAILKGSTEEKK